MTTTRLAFLRLGGIGAAVLALAASSTEGERAANGWCPAGEQCADETPEGLAFEGAQVSWFIGNAVIDTAVGGRQELRLFDKATNEPLAVGFHAVATNAAVHAATPGDGPVVQLTATGVGTGYVRVSRLADDYLFDRLRVDSKPIARAQVHPTIRTAGGTSEDGPWAVIAGGTTELAVALLDADENWLADEDMTFTTATPSTRTAWDALRVTAGSGDSLGIDLNAGGGAYRVTLAVPVVSGLTEVSARYSELSKGAGSRATVCFEARSGSLSVFGAAWTFEILGPARPLPVDEQVFEGCVGLDLTDAGQVQVIARAGGLQASTSIRVSAAKRAQRTVAAPGLSFSPQELGERAAASSED